MVLGTPQRMIVVAERLFAERGIEAVSLREVGAACGLRNNSAAQYHFGSRTGLGFQGESPGIVRPVSQWSGVDIGAVPIGQGMSVTALQMLSAYNVMRLLNELQAEHARMAFGNA